MNSTLCRAGGQKARDGVEEPHSVSDGGRDEEQDNISGADGSRRLDVTSRGDGTRMLGGNIGRGRSLDATRQPDRTERKGITLRVGTQEVTGNWIWNWNKAPAPGSMRDWGMQFNSGTT